MFLCGGCPGKNQKFFEMGRFGLGDKICFLQYENHCLVECPHKTWKPNVCVCVCVCIPEGSTVKGGRQSHDGVNHRQEAQKENEQ